MQIDNSSSTFVFDEKTKEAIEEGKNRITLLSLEETRLTKLKGSLLAEIARLEADIADKEKRDGSLLNSIEEKKKLTDEAGKALLNLESKIDQKSKDLDIKEREASQKEVSLAERERDVAKKEEVLSLNLKEVDAIKEQLIKEKELLEEKKKAIESLVKNL